MHRRVNMIALGAVVVLLMVHARVGAQVVPTPGTSGVSVTPHNLNNSGVAVENQEVCRPCHTAHNAQKDIGALWNHEINEGTSYQLYNSKHNTRFTANYIGLDEGSRLCLSCHDGAIAIDNYGGRTNGTHFVEGSARVGLNSDLTDDHPIGLSYPGLQADGTWVAAQGSRYKDPTNTTEFRGVSLVVLKAGSPRGIGCTSCHFAHGNTNGNFLRVSNQYSFMCRTCHTN
jgi:predicted CXXCH cytochrome family protein